jgi:hypothetical protein
MLFFHKMLIVCTFLNMLSVKELLLGYNAMLSDGRLLTFQKNVLSIIRVSNVLPEYMTLHL